MFEFHSVTLNLDRPGFEFLCPAACWLYLRQFTFSVFGFPSCTMGTVYLLSYRSVKKTDLFWLFNRERNLMEGIKCLQNERREGGRDENQGPSVGFPPLAFLLASLLPWRLETCWGPEPDLGNTLPPSRPLRLRGGWNGRELNGSGKAQVWEVQFCLSLLGTCFPSSFQTLNKCTLLARGPGVSGLWE